MKEKYEVVIIGAGISGLVCGCYLAKKGIKVLVVESQSKPGGLCSSFEREGLLFNTGPHYVGGVSIGVMGKILKDLSISEKIDFIQNDPSDRIITEKCEICLRSRPLDSINEFSQKFPYDQIDIKNFLDFLFSNNVISLYLKVRALTFGKLIRNFIKNPQIEHIFLTLLRGTLGISTLNIPAWIGVEVIREFFLDSGYAPRKGIHEFSNAFVKMLKEYGGELWLDSRVTKVVLKNRKIDALRINESRIVVTKKTVSSIDPYQLSTLMNLSMKKFIDPRSFRPGPSAFILCLGVKLKRDSLKRKSICLWIIEDEFIKKSFSCMGRYPTPPVVIFSPIQKNSGNLFPIQIFCLAQFIKKPNRKNFENVIKNRLLQIFYKYYSTDSKDVGFLSLVKPHIFEKYSHSYNGAIFGRNIDNLSAAHFSMTRSEHVQGLYLTGAWYNYGGLSEVALSGKRTAQLIIRDRNHK